MSEIVKVAFTGAPCTGKTTLFEKLRNDFKDDRGLMFLDETARRFFEANDVPQTERETATIQGRIQRVIFEREKIAAAEHPSPSAIICDRSVIDPAVYSLVGGNKAASDYLMHGIRHWLPTYTRLYLLDPADIPMANDGVRYEDEEHRLNIHETFLGFLAVHEIEYELLSGPLEKRAEQVKGLL